MMSLLIEDKRACPEGKFSQGVSTRITSLELARGLSALIVMLGHLRAAVFPDFQELSETSRLTGAFYLVAGMGHQAVIFFFVLSGYFVGGGVIRQGRGLDVPQYAVARLSRLWVVLIPALLLTFAVDTVVLNWLPSVLDRAHIQSWHSVPRDGVLRHSLSTFLGNVFFLQTVFVPVFGSNGPLWSLAYEAWYYILFPLMWLSFVSEAGWGRRALLFLSSLCVFAAMTDEMRWLFLAWVMGALVQFAPLHYCVVGKRAWGVFFFVLMLATAPMLSFMISTVFTLTPGIQHHLLERNDIARARIELGDLARSYPHLVLATGASKGYELTYMRIDLERIGIRQIDFPAFVDLQWTGVSDTPLAAALDRCVIPHVATPRNEVAFANISGYSGRPLFSDAVRNAFSNRFERAAHTTHFDVYVCHLTR